MEGQMKINKSITIRSLLVFSSAFILAGVANQPLVYGIEISDEELETIIEEDNNLIEVGEVVGTEVLSEKNTETGIFIEGTTQANYEVQIEDANGAVWSVQMEDTGSFTSILPNEIIGQTLSIVTLLDSQEISRQTYQLTEEVEEEVITDSEIEEEAPIIIEEPILTINNEKNMLEGQINPELKIDVLNGATLITTLTPDEQGNIKWEIKPQYNGVKLTFILIDNDGNKSNPIDLIPTYVEKQKIAETPKPAPMAKPSVTMKATQNVVKGKTYHYIRSKETLKTIASAYGITVKQLMEWNPQIKNENIINVGDLVSVDGLYVYNEIDKERKIFTGTADFIDYIAPIAQELAEKNGLYASVMIAQAAHESAWGKSSLATIGNNLSGVKGSYNGNSIVMLTWEEVNGQEVWITDYFRLYPSYREALEDYVDKLKNGVTWDPNFYKGAWVENTASHMDATDWLTGRYATDSQYATKVNATISYNNLTRFDTHIKITDPIISQRYITYVGVIKPSNATIYSEPNGSASFKAVGNTSSYAGKQVTVTQEKVNGQGTWSKITVGSKVIGWVKKELIEIEKVQSTKNISYAAKIVTTGYSIDTQPYGVEGFSKVAMSKDYYNENIIVTQEKVTKRGTFAYITKNSKGIGWIDKRALLVESVQSTSNARYAAKVVTTGNSIDTQPYGIPGFSKIGMSSEYFGKTVIVSQEKVTPRGTFAYITVNSKGIGWVDTKALLPETVIASNTNQYAATIVTKTNSIDSQPYGITGFSKLGMSADYYGQTLIATQEKTTQRGTFVYITRNGIGIGWVDKKALDPEVVLSTKNSQYAAKVITKTNSIDSQPYGISGFRKLEMSSEYFGKNIIAIQEKVTRRGTFVYITLHGKQLGWVDKKALDPEVEITSNEIQYAAKITSKSNTIDSQPYGLVGFSKIASSADYYNKNIIAKKEITTRRGTFVLITVNGKELGWIDKKALDVETALSTRAVSYGAKVISKNNSIDTQPYGLAGFEKISTSDAIFDKRVLASKEITTRRGTFVLVSLYGKSLGWIDARALEQEQVQVSRPTHYAAKIIGTNNTIDSQPYGISGFKTIARTTDASYFNKTAIINEEVETQRGIFAKVYVNGKMVGWVDKSALSVETVLSTKKVSYTAKIVTRNHSIDTLPYGIEGFERLTTTHTYYNKEVSVSEEKVTPRGTFVYISIGANEIGWVDKKSLQF